MKIVITCFRMDRLRFVFRAVGISVCIYAAFYLTNYSVSSSYQNLLSHFEDLYFRPIMVAFKEKKNGFDIDHKFRSGKTPTFLLVSTVSLEDNFWKHQLKEIVLGECPLPCSVISDRNKASEADAIVFYLRHMKDGKTMQKYVPKRDIKQPWVMLSYEAALRANSFYKTDYNEFNGLFNRTMMFRTDADIVTPHGFIVNNSDAELLPPSWLRHSDSKEHSSLEIISRRLVVTFISNCKAESGRKQYINSLQKFSTEIDVYGKCGNMTCGHSRYIDQGYKTDLDKCFAMAGKNYLFYLAFENSLCKDYVTEKVYNLLYYPLVPIVLGSAEYHKVLPPGSYIEASHYTPEKLVQYLIYLKNHPQEYHKFFEWRSTYRLSTIGSLRSMCLLCVRLYDPSFYEYKVYNDFHDWFETQANCSWTWKPGKGVTPIIN